MIQFFLSCFFVIAVAWAHVCMNLTLTFIQHINQHAHIKATDPTLSCVQVTQMHPP